MDIVGISLSNCKYLILYLHIDRATFIKSVVKVKKAREIFRMIENVA